MTFKDLDHHVNESLSYTDNLHDSNNINIDNCELNDEFKSLELNQDDGNHGNMSKNKNGMKIAHLNIATLPSHFDDFFALMMDNDFDVIGLAETRLAEYIPDSDIHLNNYCIYRNDRNRNGGGVAVYIKQSMQFTHTLRKDLMPKELEIIILEIKSSKSKPFIIVIWYRTPDSKIDLYDHFEQVLYSVEQEEKNFKFLTHSGRLDSKIAGGAGGFQIWVYYFAGKKLP